MFLDKQQKINTEILVIGGGGAGLRAAIAGAREGSRVLLVSQSPVGYGNNSAIAAGKMCVVIDPADSPQTYLKDVLSAGRFINNKSLVEILAEHSVHQVHNLGQMGVSFVRKNSDLEVGSVPGGHRLQVAMIVRVAEVALKHVVVHVADRQLNAHAGQPHGFELEPGHGACRVLGERLVYGDGNLFARRHLPTD